MLIYINFSKYILAIITSAFYATLECGRRLVCVMGPAAVGPKQAKVNRPKLTGRGYPLAAPEQAKVDRSRLAGRRCYRREESLGIVTR